MANWWERTKRAAGNVAAYGGAAATGGLSLLGKKNVRDAAGNFLADPAGSVKGAYEWASGAQDTQKAMEQQQQGLTQAGGAITDAYNQSRGLLGPYQQSGAQNFQDFSGMVRSGAFNPQHQAYQGPMSSTGRFTPQFQGFNGAMSSGNSFTPQHQAYQGPMSSGNQLPQFQGYQGPMSSGAGLPEFQQFQGAGMPQRQQGTTENVNMFMDPGYKFRLEQGLNAVQSSAAARGLLGSSGTLNSINEYAQGLASQEFGNAYGRFQEGQNNLMNDARDTRNFGYGMNQDFNTFNAQNSDRAQSRFEGDRAAGLNYNQFQNQFNAQNADRGQAMFEGDRAAGMANNQFANNFGMGIANFQQGAFEGDRAAGLNYNQFQNQFGLNQANFQQGAFEGDRAAGMQANQFQNNFNMQNGQNMFNQWNGLANMGYDSALQGANMATGYGANMAGLFGDAANARAQATMTQSAQNRGLLRDAINIGARFYGA